MRHGLDGSIAVLKFGSSILDGPEGFANAAREVATVVRRGYHVVVVVSAESGTTDTLLSSAATLSRNPPATLVSRLLATGETASVALLSIALAEEGVTSCPLGPEVLGLRTTGPVLDAEPRDVAVDALRSALDQAPAVVVPGFIGMDPSGEFSLLGRGGSDLTALFLAHRMNADECRLIKDVDGIHDRDPSRYDRTRRLEQATWAEALAVGGGVVQDKALHWARRRGLEFRVASLGGEGTLVGPDPVLAVEVAG